MVETLKKTCDDGSVVAKTAECPKTESESEEELDTYFGDLTDILTI